MENQYGDVEEAEELGNAEKRESVGDNLWADLDPEVKLALKIISDTKKNKTNQPDVADESGTDLDANSDAEEDIEANEKSSTKEPSFCSNHCLFLTNCFQLILIVYIGLGLVIAVVSNKRGEFHFKYMTLSQLFVLWFI